MTLDPPAEGPAARARPMVLAIGGSPRAGGNSDILIERFLLGAARTGARTDTIQLRDLDFTPCIGCEMCRTTHECSRFEDDLTAVYPAIVEARGLVLVSPVHNYNITAWMKGFIDRLYCFYDFTEPRPGPWSTRLQGQGRTAAVAAVAEQPEIDDIVRALDAMRRPLEALGYAVDYQLPVARLFGKGAVAECPEILETAERYGEMLGEAILGDEVPDGEQGP